MIYVGENKHEFADAVVPDLYLYDSALSSLQVSLEPTMPPLSCLCIGRMLHWFRTVPLKHCQTGKGQ